MADSLNTAILSRRTAMMAAASALALPASAVADAPVGDFDAAVYVEDMDAAGEHSYVYNTNGKVAMYCCWLPEHPMVGGDPSGRKWEAFMTELHRRDRVFQLRPGENERTARPRIHAELRRRIEGPLLADDVTGTSEYADCNARRLAEGRP